MATLDSAILRALDLPASTVAILTAHGGSGFSSTQKITIEATSSFPSRQYFLKVARGAAAGAMFAGEHVSLSAIHNAVPSLCPASFGAGPMDNDVDTYFLVTEFLELGGQMRGSSGDGGSGMSLAAKLAKLHTTPAPIPKDHENPMFGFPVTTCCGDTPQPNPYTPLWADFYGECRLRAIYRRAELRHGRDNELRQMVERIVETVVPRLLAKDHLGGSQGIIPVVVHGDLWTGNQGTGRIGRENPMEQVVFDPSSCYAHSEFELGIMRMFGGFGGSFWREYHATVPKTEPVAEYEDRVKLYELYHHLNHTAIFGGSYRHGAMKIMKELWKKYGNEE